jgi:subtilisin family serine protease
MAFGGFNGGIYVATGDVNGDGFNDIVIGADAAASAHVKYFNGRFLAARDLISADADFDVLISGASDENGEAADNTDNNHGTHVAGTIGAMGNNGLPQSSTSVGSAKVVVAVIDTGIDYRYTDLYTNVWVN